MSAEKAGVVSYIIKRKDPKEDIMKELDILNKKLLSELDKLKLELDKLLTIIKEIK